MESPIIPGPFQTLQPLILASASPRRQQFLSDLGLTYTVKTANIVEQILSGEPPPQFVRRMAAEKAQVIADLNPGSWVIGADTVVVCQETILGKPSGPKEAFIMLKKLAGVSHQVWTGFAIMHKASGALRTGAAETEVVFADLPDDAINAYIKTGEPLDKAGAYGIQGIGGFMVASVNGSYSNVVGLPLAEVIKELMALKVISPRVGH